MTYASGQLIQASDYNGFVANNANNVNAWWGTGLGNSGWGQTALSTVAAGNTITAASWAGLVNAIQAGASHTGTSITSRTAPSAGNTITVFPNLDTDIGSVKNNRANAVASGSTNGSWSGTASVTSSTGTGNENWTITWTNTVTFGSTDQARYFFNAGGLVRIQMGKSSTGTTKDTFWNSLVGAVGSIFIAGGIGASQSISGTEYTGVTVLGSSGSYTSNTSAGWYYLLANGSTQIYQKTQTSSPYTSDAITVTATASGSILTITVVWNSPGLSGQSNNSISGGTATSSPFTSFGSAPAVVINTVYPSTTYLSDSWSTNSIAESVSVSTSPGPAPAAAEFLVIGGGGGGAGAGGGGGGMVYRSSLTLPVSGQSFPVIIGAGGLASVGTATTASYGGSPGSITVYYGASATGGAGSTTSIDANGTIVQAYGGGAGGSVNSNPAALIGSAGGPPIFNGSTSLSGAVGTGGTAYYASNATGTSYHGGANQGACGGGGGAGSAGSASITANVQVGGNGYEYWTGYGFAAGGGAGGYSSLGGDPFPSSGTYGGSTNTAWYGGRAGVLAGDRSSGVYNNGYENAQSALSNTGSGGGGAAYGEVIYGQGAGTMAGNGGSGAIVIRYPGASSILSYSGQWTTNITGGYVYHLLTTSGSLYPSGEAPTPTPPSVAIEYQLIGGGGTGGIRGGGGGAGGVKQSSGTLVGGASYTVFIGAGASGLTGSAAAAAGYGGQNSDFTGTGISAVGGGGGYGAAEGVYGSAGGPGGSGGGGAMPTGPGGIADPFSYGTLGYPGGQGENQYIGAYTFGEAGGGGASQQGNNGSYGAYAGTGGGGGAGILCYDNVYRAGGGGGSGRAKAGYGGNWSYTRGNSYGATAGATPDLNTLNATANSGSGSGGAYAEGSSVSTGNGGSGVLVIRYLGTTSKISYTGNYTTQTIGGYVVHTLTSSGTLTTIGDPNAIPSGTVVTANTWSAGSTGPLPANQHYNWSSPYTAIWFGTHPSAGNTVYFPFIPSVTQQYWWLARVDDSATAYISAAVSTSTNPTGISYTTVGTSPGWTNLTFYSLGTLQAGSLYWLKVVISDAGSNYGYWHFITSSTALTPSGKGTDWPPLNIVTTCNGNGTTYTNGYPTYTAP
jgi:hypothetical protein